MTFVRIRLREGKDNLWAQRRRFQTPMRPRQHDRPCRSQSGMIRLLIPAALAFALFSCNGDSDAVDPTATPSRPAAAQLTRTPEVTRSPEQASATPKAEETSGPSPTAEPTSTPNEAPQPTQAPTAALGGEIVVSPGSSIAKAVTNAVAGSRIRVRAGTYLEEIDFGKAVTVEAYGDGEVIIDAQCARQHGFRIWGSGAVVRGFTIRNTIAAGILLEANGNQRLPSNVTIDGNRITDFDCQELSDDQYRAGVAVWYSGPGIQITNNYISRRSSGEPRGWANGIWFKSSNDIPSGGNHYIAGNTIIGGWDGIGNEVEYEAHGGFDRDTIIEGLQAEGGAQNVIVRNNDIAGCGTGIAFAAPITGPLYIENNFIHDLRRGYHDNMYCFKAGNPGQGTTFLTGNRCIVDSAAEMAQGGANGLQHTDPELAPIVARNNVFRVSRYIFETRPGTNFAGTSFDGDCLWSVNPESFLKWEDVDYFKLSEFTAATGMEANGRQSPDCGS
jgi:hypothetical protein